MRGKNVFYSLLTSIAYQFTLTICNFFIIKLMIINYGSEINGLNATIQQIINYMNLVEAGLALTAIQSLYKPLANSNWSAINGILSATKELYKKSGIAFLLILFLISGLYPYILNTEIAHVEISLLLLVMAGGSVVEYFLNGKLRVLLMSDQKSYVINSFQVISLITSTFIKIVLIKVGLSYIIVQAIGTIALLLRFLLTKRYVMKKYPLLSYKAKPDHSSLQNRWSVLFHQVAGMVVFNSPVIIISIFVGLKEASVYAVYNLVFNGLIMIIGMFSKSTVASFGNLIFTESAEKTRNIFMIYQTTFFIFGTWIYTVAFIMINPFIRLYTFGVKDIVYENTILAILFTVIGILNMIRVPNNTMIEAAGHYKQTRNRAFLEATINLSVSIILVQVIGIYGVLIGAVSSYMYRSIDIIVYSSKKILSISPKVVFKNGLTNLIVGLLIVVFTSFTLEIYTNTWIGWIVYSFIISISVGTVLIIFNFLFYRKTLMEIISHIKVLLKSK